MKNKINFGFITFFLIITVLITPKVTNADILYSQVVTLESGWNIISTPKVLDTYEFSATENSDNFDIYVLDSSNTSGWSTMADISQSTFTPLYGYFINNKTPDDQTLTFNYKDGTTPAERLFEKSFSTTGWYSIGVANPSYVKKITAGDFDSNYPSSVLRDLDGSYSSVIDLTRGNTSLSSVSVSAQWDSATSQDVNNLKDFRETKGYAIFINNISGVYSGFQNNNQFSSGTATADIGDSDPNSSTTKKIGETGYVFSAVKLIAGSDEDIVVKSIRFYQGGSASASDLENIKVYVDGSPYNVSISADERYYTASFTDNIVIGKGLSKEILIKGDIKSGVGKTIVFNIIVDTEIEIVDNTYGYEITATASSTATASNLSSQFTTREGKGTVFWFDASVVTISDGDLTASNATSVEAQNILVNVANEPLGGFDVVAEGEQVSAARMVFNLMLTGSGGVGTDINNVTLVLVDGTDAGSVVAGPVDATGTSTVATVTFTDTVTFPIGTGTYTLKGQLGTDFVNDQTITASTTPATDWTTVTGDTTGNSITPSPATAITSNIMTVKTGSATISTSASPVAQNIVAGAQAFTFANFQIDATASSEDVRFSSLVTNLTASADSEYLTGCRIWDGTTVLNTGSNIKDVASGITTATGVTFTLDSGGLVIAKGTTKTVALKCDLSASASNQTYLWNITTTQTGTGLTSGATITTATPTGSGQIMTATSGGALTVTKDDSSPSYKIAASGTTDVVLGALKFSGTNEAITLNKVGLELTAVSSLPSDLTRVTLWDGTTQVGSTIFISTDYATSTLTGTFTIPKDGSKVLTIRGDLAAIGTSQIGTQGALLKVNYNGTDLLGTQGVGDQSGATITSTSSSDTAVDGVRVFRVYPEFAKIALSSNSLTSGTTDFYKFSVTAVDSDGYSDGIGIHKFTLNLATSSDNAVTGSTTVTNLKVYAYTDSSFSSSVDSSADGTAYTSGQIVNTIPNPQGSTTGADNDLVLNHVLQIPAGETYYFKVVGDATIVSGTGTSANNWVKAEIIGDNAYPAGVNLMDAATVIDSDINNNFIWSPYALTTSALTTEDWTNGYKVTGLDGMEAVTISQ